MVGLPLILEMVMDAVLSESGLGYIHVLSNVEATSQWPTKPLSAKSPTFPLEFIKNLEFQTYKPAD